MHWSKIEQTIGLADFIYYARRQIEPNLRHTPEKFQELNEFLWPQNWLIRYADKTYIGQSLNGMARRRLNYMRLAALLMTFIAI